MKSLMTTEERADILQAAMDCIKSLQDDDKLRQDWMNTRENTIKEIEAVLANPTPPPTIRKSEFSIMSEDEIDMMLNASIEKNDTTKNILSQSDIKALLRPFKDDEDETTTIDKLNKTKYNSDEFHSTLDDIQEKEY